MQHVPFPEICAPNGVSYLVCLALKEQTGLAHCFSTRLGGVSLPPKDSLNLSHAESDGKGLVAENYARLMAAAIPAEAAPVTAGIAFTKQVHRDYVRLAGKKDCLPVEEAGRAAECDGLVTAEKHVVLAGCFADCVPILLYDRAKHACGVVHAGWRGTAMAIAPKGVAAMAAHFGSRPGDLIAAVGPSIAACCFLCHEDVTGAMENLGNLARPYIQRAADGRFSVDLKQINGRLLESAGVGQVYICPSCTCCDETRFFSHRRQGKARGSLSAMIGLF